MKQGEQRTEMLLLTSFIVVDDLGDAADQKNADEKRHLQSTPSPIDWLPVRQLPGWHQPDNNNNR